VSNNSVSIAAFSDAVSTIYDCALDPALWPDAIREICHATRCIAGVISVSDLATGAGRLQQVWNFGPDWLERMIAHGPEVAEMINSVPNLFTRSLDEPMVATRDIAPEVLERSRYFKEWIVPQGIIDALQLTVLRQRNQYGALALSRHGDQGPVTDHDIAVLRLLAPHIRRAVAISDLLGMRAIAASTFEASLDLLQTGVVLVDGEARIIHANRTAQAMLEIGSPIRSHRGELYALIPEASSALKVAIAKAAADQASVGRPGLGVPAPQADGQMALIHVLPLTGGDLRTRIAPRARAALFITSADSGAVMPAEALATLFDLTAAQARTLERLLAGETLGEAAEELGIAVTTARTHLANIFAKTGTSRQSELIRLAARFSPPIGRPAS
jgi:DNA-binding CsgD family transcriptional regulator/PAS domain-containing protein